ncbi:MAG: hypothetical protein ACXW1W_18245 [Methylococcaceae bacterium]
MQLQRTIQTVDSPHLIIEVPASFVHRQVEILVITLDETDLQPTRKRRIPPPQFAGRVKELDDVMSSVSVDDWE